MRHRIAASAVVEILQFLTPEIGLNWRSYIRTDLLDAERTNLKDEPIYPPKNSAHLVEPRPLQHACVSICINENLVDCP